MNSKKPKILLGPSSFAELDKTPLRTLELAGYEMTENPFKRKLTKKEITDLLSENITGLIAGLEPLDREVLKKSTLKVISRVGSGLSNIDLDAAKEFGIKVCYTPYGPTRAVAELTIGTMLSLIRMVPLMDRNLHDTKWNKKIGMQLEGKTVAIIGFGRIGKCVAKLLYPFNTKIIVVDPFANEGEINFPVFPLNEAISQADIITNHSSGDQCLIGPDEFSIMKEGVYILNPARGGLVSETALIKALDENIVAGAWLDTFEIEPYDGPLTNYEQVILTPHVGSYTFDCRRQMEFEAVQNLLKALEVIS